MSDLQAITLDSSNNWINAELNQGETILWLGQPDPKYDFTPLDLWWIPQGLCFWVGAGLNLYSNLRSSFYSITWLLLCDGFALALFCFSGYFTFGRFYVKRWMKKMTWYLVTDKRILILVKRKTVRTRSADIKEIKAFEKNLRSDGSGALIFGDILASQASFNSNTGMEFLTIHYTSGPFAFYDIHEGNNVLKLIKEVKASLELNNG
jgi:hypothetical protein